MRYDKKGPLEKKYFSLNEGECKYTPTPKEIRRACERIQTTWSNREREKRAGKNPDGYYTPPIISVIGIDNILDDYEDNFCNPAERE